MAHLASSRVPTVSLRFVAVWRRNALVWRKLIVASLLGNLADPMIVLLGIGYGLGALLPSVEGMSYMAFFAAGSLCSASMNTASFEATYSAFSRMHGQKTWDAILHAPLTIDDVVLGELVWAASKALLTGATILAVAALLGLTASPLALFALPLAFLTGLAFAALALLVTVLARGWDLFSYYFTLGLTPMLMLSGVFFPVAQLPEPVRMVTSVLPLYHAVALVRPLMQGVVPADAGLHVAVLAAYALLGWYAALLAARRRFSL